MGIDVGPEPADTFADVASKARLILWNGLLGVSQQSKFTKVYEVTKYCVTTAIGEGDIATACVKFGRSNNVSYVVFLDGVNCRRRKR